MKRKTVVSVATLAAMCLADVAAFNVAQAFNMGDMFSPNRWFGSNNRSDRYYDRGYYGGYGGPYGRGGGPYGWGGGPYGYGGYGGGPYGWGGYGRPYGYGGYPGYGGYGGYGGQPSTIVVNPSTGGAGKSAPPPPRLPE
jgi:hypothetical protein